MYEAQLLAHLTLKTVIILSYIGSNVLDFYDRITWTMRWVILIRDSPGQWSCLSSNLTGELSLACILPCMRTKEDCPQAFAVIVGKWIRISLDLKFILTVDELRNWSLPINGRYYFALQLRTLRGSLWTVRLHETFAVHSTWNDKVDFCTILTRFPVSKSVYEVNKIVILPARALLSKQIR